jgi:hypothetical protein
MCPVPGSPPGTVPGREPMWISFVVAGVGSQRRRAQRDARACARRTHQGEAQQGEAHQRNRDL